MLYYFLKNDHFYIEKILSQNGAKIANELLSLRVKKSFFEIFTINRIIHLLTSTMSQNDGK